MARDGLGNFNLSEPPFVYGTTILEDVMNNVLSDIASGLTQSISRDGQTLPTAPLPMGGYRHTGVGNASARNQYAAAGQVQDGAFTWCGTAGGTANALTLAPSPAVVAYVAGQRFLFTAAAANTDAVTVAVSGLAATAVQNAGAALVSGNIAAGRLYLLAYDGSAFQISDISLTPAAPVQATETVSGISRQATIAEAKSGTSTTPEAKPHVTPEGVAAALAPVGGAVTAIGERTTALETVGPPKLSTASGTAPSYSARAWVNFNGAGTVAIRASGNVTSVTDNGTGSYTLNFSVALPDANYATLVTVGNISGLSFNRIGAAYNPATNSVSVTSSLASSSGVDFDWMNVAVFR